VNTDLGRQNSSGFLAPENFLYYPAHIPEQIGWVIDIAYYFPPAR